MAIIMTAAFNQYEHNSDSFYFDERNRGSVVLHTGYSAKQKR